MLIRQSSSFTAYVILLEIYQFEPETTDMNGVDLEDEIDVDEGKPKSVDQAKDTCKKATLETAMAKRYGGVAIKGFKKTSKLAEIVETLKKRLDFHLIMNKKIFKLLKSLIN